MLIHEIPDGGYAWIGDMLFVRFPGMAIAERVPPSVQVIHEADGTLSLAGFMNVWVRGNLSTAFMIHDTSYVIDKPYARAS